MPFNNRLDQYTQSLKYSPYADQNSFQNKETPLSSPKGSKAGTVFERSFYSVPVIDLVDKEESNSENTKKGQSSKSSTATSSMGYSAASAKQSMTNMQINELMLITPKEDLQSTIMEVIKVYTSSIPSAERQKKRAFLTFINSFTKRVEAGQVKNIDSNAFKIIRHIVGYAEKGNRFTNIFTKLMARLNGVNFNERFEAIIEATLGKRININGDKLDGNNFDNSGIHTKILQLTDENNNPIGMIYNSLNLSKKTAVFCMTNNTSETKIASGENSPKKNNFLCFKGKNFSSALQFEKEDSITVNKENGNLILNGKFEITSPEGPKNLVLPEGCKLTVDNNKIKVITMFSEKGNEINYEFTTNQMDVFSFLNNGFKKVQNNGILKGIISTTEFEDNEVIASEKFKGDFKEENNILTPYTGLLTKESRNKNDSKILNTQHTLIKDGVEKCTIERKEERLSITFQQDHGTFKKDDQLSFLATSLDDLPPHIQELIEKDILQNVSSVNNLSANQLKNKEGGEEITLKRGNIDYTILSSCPHEFQKKIEIEANNIAYVLKPKTKTIHTIGNKKYDVSYIVVSSKQDSQSDSESQTINAEIIYKNNTNLSLDTDPVGTKPKVDKIRAKYEAERATAQNLTEDEKALKEAEYEAELKDAQNLAEHESVFSGEIDNINFTCVSGKLVTTFPKEIFLSSCQLIQEFEDKKEDPVKITLAFYNNGKDSTEKIGYQEVLSLDLKDQNVNNEGKALKFANGGKKLQFKDAIAEINKATFNPKEAEGGGIFILEGEEVIAAGSFKEIRLAAGVSYNKKEGLKFAPLISASIHSSNEAAIYKEVKAIGKEASLEGIMAYPLTQKVLSKCMDKVHPQIIDGKKYSDKKYSALPNGKLPMEVVKNIYENEIVNNKLYMEEILKSVDGFKIILVVKFEDEYTFIEATFKHGIPISYEPYLVPTNKTENFENEFNSSTQKSAFLSQQNKAYVPKQEVHFYNFTQKAYTPMDKALALIAKKKSLTGAIEDFITIAVDVLRAIEVKVKQGKIVTDLKLDNLLADFIDGKLKVKISDLESIPYISEFYKSLEEFTEDRMRVKKGEKAKAGEEKIFYPTLTPDNTDPANTEGFFSAYYRAASNNGNNYYKVTLETHQTLVATTLTESFAQLISNYGYEWKEKSVALYKFEYNEKEKKVMKTENFVKIKEKGWGYLPIGVYNLLVKVEKSKNISAEAIEKIVEIFKWLSTIYPDPTKEKSNSSHLTAQELEAQVLPFIEKAKKEIKGLSGEARS